MLTLFSVAPAPGGVGAAGGPIAGVLAAEQAAFVHLLTARSRLIAVRRWFASSASPRLRSCKEEDASVRPASVALSEDSSLLHPFFYILPQCAGRFRPPGYKRCG